MKLLNESLKAYLIYSALMLFVSVPAFYIEIKNIVAEDVDEDLLTRKADIISHIKNPVTDKSLELFKVFEPDFYIEAANPVQRKDSFYTITVYDSILKEEIPHRVLESSVLLSGRFYNIKIRNSLVDNDELIFAIVSVQAILVLLIIAGLLIITRSFSKKLWKPFYTTLKKLQEYRIDSEEKLQLENSSIDEFSELNQTIINLTKRNRQVFLSQKEFTENASHELQTPLAVFNSKVELLMQTIPLTKEQAGLITELSQAGQKMNRLNKTLLLLSKIDNNQFAITESVNIDHIVEKLADQYRNAINQKNISLHKRVIDENLIKANPTLIEILIGNILSNAIRHNVTGGEIHILIVPGKLIVSNTSSVKSLDESRLFQRFQKQTADTNSLGLGLEIARRICAIHKATITYNYASNMHTFTIIFNG